MVVNSEYYLWRTHSGSSFHRSYTVWKVVPNPSVTGLYDGIHRSRPLAARGPFVLSTICFSPPSYPTALWAQECKKHRHTYTLLLLESLKPLSTCQKSPPNARISGAKCLLSCLSHQSDVQTQKMLYNKASIREIPHYSSVSLNHCWL